MRTFLARKYMRKLEWVGRREIALGLLLVLLTAGVVAAFVIHVRTNRDFLFNVDERALGAGEDSRAVFVARQLLPPLGEAGWQPAGEPVVAAVEELPQAFADRQATLAAFGVTAAYTRRHVTAEGPKRVIDVLVCDAQTPAQALGVSYACHPAGAGPLAAGGGGWATADETRAGFWSGRYYTEVRTPTAPEGEGLTASRVARLHAAVQLVYGGTFWANDLLNTGETKPDTFHYLHTRAFGLAPLEKVFAIERMDGLTAWILDAHSAAGAQRIHANLESAASAASPAGEYGGEATKAPRRQGAVTAIACPEGTLAFFTWNRYVQGVVGRDENAVLRAAAAAYETAVGGSGASPAVAVTGDEADQLFPDAGFADWQAPRRVDRFSADDLYVKIDGRADAYLQFHVVELRFGTYFRLGATERTIDVYWYDMGEPANAYGIYGLEATPGAERVDVGREGYVVDGAVFFRQGPAYVQVLPADPVDAEAARAIAERIAGTVPTGAEDEQWADGVLPAAGRVADSAAYIASDAFGLDFLADVYTADYNMDGAGKLTLFVHRAADADAATSLLAKYEASFSAYGKVLWKDEARTMVAGEVAGLVDVVFAKGRYLAGVAGAEDGEAAKAAAIGFCDGMKTE